MKTLSHTWFAEGYIDFELKKYTLLAYLQEIHKEFTQNKLYPQLSDIIFHHNNILHFKHNKEMLQEQFPKRFTHVNMDKLQLLYEKIVEDDEMMKELEDIIQSSILDDISLLGLLHFLFLLFQRCERFTRRNGGFRGRHRNHHAAVLLQIRLRSRRCLGHR